MADRPARGLCQSNLDEWPAWEMGVISRHRGLEAEPEVVVIVLNWNNAPETLGCLESVLRLDYLNCRVLVVDNGSNDDSVPRIRSQFPEVELLPNETNLGYAEGNNVGIRHATKTGAKYLLLLNNDVRVASDCLTELVSAAERFPEAAFLGPKVYHLDRPEQIQSAGAQLDSLWRSRQRGLDEVDQGQFDRLEEVDYVIGGAMLVRVDPLEQIGLLDRDFFIYREDVDWCLRARQLGYSILYVPTARVWHRSHHTREAQLPFITYYMTRNSLMLIAKHNGGVARFMKVLLRQLLTAVTWTVKPKWRHKRIERDALLRGLADFFRGKVGQGHA